MKANQKISTDKLWEVNFSIDENKDECGLWILAKSIGAASNKAIRFLKETRVGRIKINGVTSRGTIDVF